MKKDQELHFKKNIKFNHVCKGSCSHKRQKLEKDVPASPLIGTPEDNLGDLKPSESMLKEVDDFFERPSYINQMVDDIFVP